MVIMQNDRFHYRLTIVGKGDTPRELRLIQVKNGKEAILAHVPYRADNVILSIQGDGLKYAFTMVKQMRICVRSVKKWMQLFVARM